MTTEEVLAALPTSIAVAPFPDKKAQRAAKVLEFARSVVVQDQGGYELASMELRSIKSTLEEAEADRTFIVKPLNDHVKAINARFKEALTGPLSEAERIIKLTMTTYADEQERIRREAEAKAAAESRRMREEAERQARMIEEKAAAEAKAQREAAERAARAADEAASAARAAREAQDKARREGDAKAAKAAQEEAERLERERRVKEEEERKATARAEKTELAGAQAAAGAVQDAIAAASAPVVLPEAAKAIGVSYRTSYDVEVESPEALIEAVLKGTVPREAVIPDTRFLKKQANAFQGRLNYPGVKVVTNRTLASRS